jgi:hypothetical protein
MQMRRLSASFEGDVDLLGGRLEWAHSEELQGDIKWPPSMNYLVAIDAKCAYQDPDAAVISPETLKSTKASPQKTKRIRQNIDQLIDMGFDRVALLDLIANPPVGGPGSGGWLNALAVAGLSMEAMAPVLKGRLPSETRAGRFVLSIGAVEGGLEDKRGAISTRMLREARLAATGEVQIYRKEVEDNLLKVLADLPRPKVVCDRDRLDDSYVSFVFDDCVKCGKVHQKPFCDPC